MAVSFLARGTGGTPSGTGTVTPAMPTGYAADDLLVSWVATDGTQPTTPSGWVNQGSWSGGAGAQGADSGTRRVTCFTRVATSGAEAAPSYTLVSGTVVTAAQVEAYRKTVAGPWSLAATGGSDSTGGASYAVTGGSLAAAAGDMIAVGTATNSDGSGSGSGRTVTIPGCTVGAHTSGANITTGTGDDQRLDTGYAPVNSGASTGPPSYAATYSVAGTDWPSGATGFLRLREPASTSSVTVTHTFDAGTSGAAVTTSGGGDPLDVVPGGTAPNNGSAQYGDPAFPRGQSCRISTGTTSAQAWVAWTSATLPTLAEVWARAYLWLSNAFAAPVSILQVASGGTARIRAQILTDRRVRVLDAAGGTLATSTTALSLGQWWRLELHADLTTSAAWELRLFVGDSTTPVETLSGSAANLGGTADTIRFGLTAAQADLPATWLDSLGVSNAGWLGPDPAANQAPIANAGPDQAGVEPFATVTLAGSALDDTGSPSLAWTQTSGPVAVTLSGSGGTRTFTAPPSLDGMSLTFRLTATDGGGLTDTDDVTVDVLPTTERIMTAAGWLAAQVQRWSGTSWQ